MQLLICEECDACHYSASAALLAEQGARCERCGARLTLGGDAVGTPTGEEQQESVPTV